MERTDSGYLEDEIEIKTSPRFLSQGNKASLKVFDAHSSMGCMVVFVLVISVLLYFLSTVTLLIFLSTLTISAIGYLIRYQYSFRKKPVLLIDHQGVKEKDQQYYWEEMKDLSCSEEFDNERGLFTGTHLRFMYRGKVTKVYIGGYDKSVEEIVHYVALFRR